MNHPRFSTFCFASFLLSLSYGATFLLSLLITSLGGNERDAGQVFAVVMLSTLVAVVGSGPLMTRFGVSRCIALGAGCLVLASAGFASVVAVSPLLMACGVLLGIGWGLFYTLGPILVAAMIEPTRRTHCFALLSGSMLSGIGSGPLLGKAAGLLGLPVQTAFLCAAVAAAVSGWYFWQRQDPAASGQNAAAFSLKSAGQVLRSRSVFSIIAVGLGGAIFGGLGSFQTSYAASLGLDYALFYIGFMGAAICCRLLVSGWVVKRDPFATACVLTGLMLLAVIGFDSWVTGSVSYLLTAALLGVGYGLNYSVINGLVANEAPAGMTAQALLLFSLGYFVGVFGFPFIAGQLIAGSGMQGMLLAVKVIAGAIWLLSVGRLVSRRSRLAVNV